MFYQTQRNKAVPTCFLLNGDCPAILALQKEALSSYPPENLSLCPLAERPAGREQIDSTTSSAQISGHSIVSSGINKTYSYTYDDNGNILSISDGTNTVSYVYDKANQLVRENNQGGNYTHTWTYDDAGNILARKVYGYTTGSLEGITPNDTVNYTYGDAQWGDLLTAYDGQTFVYDGIGNPLTQTDVDGNTVRSFQWKHGRQLAAMTIGGQTWTYTYNADGLRTSKSNGTATYQYIYDGSKLTQMVYGSNTLYFSYDAAGTPLTVTYNGTTYYYVTNVQGDVIAVLSQNGSLVASYSYDAWGNLLSIGGSLADTLGTLNSLRYRGYVYDLENNLTSLVETINGVDYTTSYTQ